MILTPDARTTLLLAGIALGYLLLMAANPARPSLRDGLRCLRRYPQLWALPVLFGLTHAGFNLAVRMFEGFALTPSGLPFAPWAGRQDIDWPAAAARAALPAAEGAAGLFNVAVTTFPLSAVAALGFLLNWRGHAGTLGRALRRRFGLVRGGGIIFGLGICAVGAALKPALFIAGLLRLEMPAPATTLLRLGAAVDWLGFIFEYLLGVAVQTFLVTLAFAWVRGLSFEGPALRRFALRRGTLVAPWAFAIILVSGLGINGPLAFVAAGGAAGGDEAGGSAGLATLILRGTEIARWLLAALLVGFASVSIQLAFHNYSLPRAVRAHGRLLRRHGDRVGWFIAVAAVHFFALSLADDALRQALGGERTLGGALWVFTHATLWGTLAGWLLASWVCLFRRLDTGRAEAEELVHF